MVDVTNGVETVGWWLEVEGPSLVCFAEKRVKKSAGVETTESNGVVCDVVRTGRR